MQASFWQQKWQNNELGFHLPEPHPKLVRHIKRLGLKPGDRVFLPLCGKSLDIAWLLQQGFRVVGAEWVQQAVEQLFTELDVEPVISREGELRRYSAEQLDIFVGDIFTLDAETLGAVDAVYDRAALVALPTDKRALYSRHLATISGCAPQLLISFEYDQSQLSGPPFSVPPEEVRGHYQDMFTLELLESKAIKGGLKGKCPADEQAWLLSAKPQ